VAAWNYIGGNINFDTTAAGFTAGTWTGTTQDGDLLIAILNARNGEVPTLPTGGTDWTYVGSSPTASNNLTGSNSLSQIFVYYCIRSGGTDPSRVVSRGTGPDLCNYNFHVFRPASGYKIEYVTSSFETDGTATLSHTHAAVSTSEVDDLIVHYIGTGSSSGASVFDATDPATDSGAGSTSYTGTMTQDQWERRGNQGTSSLLDGSLHCAVAIKSSTGSTGTLSATMTISRRNASFVGVFRQVLLEAAPTGVVSGGVVGTPTITQNHSLTPTGITSASVVGQPAATIDRSFSPTGISSGGTVGNPALTQVHATAPNNVVSGGVVGSPALTQNHVLTPTGVTSTGVVGQPAATEQASAVSVTPTGIVSGGVVGNPALTQNHATAPTGVVSASVVGNPALAQVHAITPAGVASASVVGQPALTQNHPLTPVGVTSAAVVGQPAITAQNHALTPIGISTSGPVVGIVTLNPSGTGNNLPPNRGMIVDPGVLTTRT